MIKRFLLIFLFIISLAFFYPFLITLPAQAAVKSSECVIVNVNISGTPQNIPEACAGNGPILPNLGTGIIYPPNLSCPPTGYCKMPDSLDGSYNIYSNQSDRLGLKKLIGVIYTVSQRWKKLYPNGYVMVGDLNAPGHASHKIGVDVDVYASTDGKDCVSNYDDGDRNPACGTKNYNKKATVEFGKLFADTGAINVIFYNDKDVDSQVLKANTRSPGMQMYPWPNHANHFHVRIKP